MSAHLTADQAHALLMLILDTEACSGAYNLKPPPYGSGTPDVDITPLLGQNGQEMADKFLRWAATGKQEPNYTVADWQAGGSGAVDLTSAQVEDLLDVLEYMIDVMRGDIDPEYELDENGNYEGSCLWINFRDAETGYEALKAGR